MTEATIPQPGSPCEHFVANHALPNRGIVGAMVGRRLLLVCVWIILLVSTAWAHGGGYTPTFKAPTSEPERQRETATDPAAALTRWEVWWSVHRDRYLRFPEANRNAARAVTGGDGAERSVPPDDANDDLARLQRMQRVMPVLERALDDSDPEVRGAAAIALGKTGLDRAAKLIVGKVVKETAQEPFDAQLLALGLLGREEGVTILDEVLSRGGDVTFSRAYAAVGLGFVGGEMATVSLIRFLDEKADGVADVGRRRFRLEAAAVTALGMAGGEDALAWLRAKHQSLSRRSNLRPFVVLALGRLRDATSKAALLADLDRKHPVGSRRAAAFALGRVLDAKDGPARLTLLTSLQEDRDPLVRRYAALSLGRLDDQDVRDRLLEVFVGGDEEDRAHVALALGLQQARAAIPKLREALEAEKDGSRRSSYVTALGLLADKSSIEVIRTELTASRDPWRRAYAALALGMLGDDGARPLLWKELRATDQAPLRANVALALGMLGDPQLSAELVRRLERPQSRTEAAGMAIALGTVRPMDALDDLIRIADEQLKRSEGSRTTALPYVIVSIGRLVDPRPIPRLTELALDHDPSLVVRPLDVILGIL